MFEVFVKTHFSAAHYLREYPGKCERLHGHNWLVEAVVRAERLNEIDVGIDFHDLKKAVATVMEELDHTNINEHPAFRDVNPSSEKLAQYIYRRLQEELESFPEVEVARITVCETPNNGVTFQGEE